MPNAPSDRQSSPWPHGIEGATAADLSAARRLCDALPGERVMAHDGLTTDLILGGGCPRCIAALRVVVRVRVEGAAIHAPAPATPASRPLSLTCEQRNSEEKPRCGKPGAFVVASGFPISWTICQDCLEDHRRRFRYEFDNMVPLADATAAAAPKVKAPLPMSPACERLMAGGVCPVCGEPRDFAALLAEAMAEEDTWRGFADRVCPGRYAEAYWLLLDAGMFDELNRMTEAEEAAAPPPEGAPHADDPRP